MQTPTRTALQILAIFATILIPATIALSTVEETRPLVPFDPQPTPLGYTWSLLLFVVPAVVLGAWFHFHPNYRAVRSGFWISLGFLFGLGALLDILFGSLFFTFPNAGSNIGFMVPVVGGEVPIEEFGFYSIGFAAILLTYLWCNEFWLGEYYQTVRDQAKARTARSLVSFHGPSALGFLMLVGAGFAWKWYGPGASGQGIPGYFIFLMASGVLPNVLFFKAVANRINWRALCFTGLLLLPVSLLWEGVLASPYGWWGYQPDQMLGIFINGFSGLPIEAVLLWLVVAYAGVVIYEVVRLVLGAHSEAI